MPEFTPRSSAYYGETMLAAKDLLSPVTSTVDSLVDAGKNAVNDLISSVVGVAQDVLPSVMSALAQPTFRGSLGSFGYIGTYVQLYMIHIPIADEALSLKGRPVMKMVMISTIPGFVLCDNAKLPTATATADETAAIEAFMNKGFYYE